MSKESELTKSCRVERKKRRGNFQMSSDHYHRHYEMFYLVSGRCRMFVNHTIYHLEAGDIILLPPMAIHRSSYAREADSERMNFYITEACWERWKELCGAQALAELFDRGKISVLVGHRAYLEELMQKMEYEQENTDKYSRLMTENYLYEMAVFLARCAAVPEKAQTLTESELVINDAAQYIYEHYMETLTLDMMAAQVHMSPTHFSRKFKQVTGFGYKEYLNHIRIREAAHRLLHSTESVTEIALSCGFGDGNYFGDVFRREKGISPRAYRHMPMGAVRDNAKAE